jgi:hypothetical protein
LTFFTSIGSSEMGNVGARNVTADRCTLAASGPLASPGEHAVIDTDASRMGTTVRCVEILRAWFVAPIRVMAASAVRPLGEGSLAPGLTWQRRVLADFSAIAEDRRADRTL